MLKTVWNNYVTPYMSDYEKAVAAEQWVSTHIETSGTSASVKTALEKGNVNYTGRANTYKKIFGTMVTAICVQAIMQAIALTFAVTIVPKIIMIRIKISAIKNSKSKV